MSSSGSIGDPRTGRDRRVPTKARTFKDGAIDPIIEKRRPLLTWGNAILLAIMVSYGLYATGNLPQLDAFFDSLDKKARGRNDLVVHSLIAYGPYLFGAVIFAVFGLFVFLFINSRRRQLSDPKGWDKIADRAPERRQRDRRTEDLPSMVMPIGKERPGRRATDTPREAPVAAKTASAPAAEPAAATKEASAVAPAPAPAAAVEAAPNSAKAAALAAAAKAEAALEAAPADLPSFVMPLGKVKKTSAPPPAEIASVAATPDSVPIVSAPPAAAAVTLPVPAVTAEPTATNDTPSLSASAASAKVEAAIAAAKAAAAKAEATVAMAKAEAAMAAAKAETAIAEAAMAAAKAEAAAIPGSN